MKLKLTLHLGLICCLFILQNTFIHCEQTISSKDTLKEQNTAKLSGKTQLNSSNNNNVRMINPRIVEAKELQANDNKRQSYNEGSLTNQNTLIRGVSYAKPEFRPKINDVTGLNSERKIVVADNVNHQAREQGNVQKPLISDTNVKRIQPIQVNSISLNNNASIAREESDTIDSYTSNIPNERLDAQNKPIKNLRKSEKEEIKVVNVGFMKMGSNPTDKVSPDTTNMSIPEIRKTGDRANYGYVSDVKKYTDKPEFVKFLRKDQKILSPNIPANYLPVEKVKELSPAGKVDYIIRNIRGYISLCKL